ncbi:MAG: DUF4115 domain-containing protein [Deltaproteobacteria bacterium]|nr:DUF4115 domain-containing protein [Deltaproteobacteria bacterium]
MAVFELEAMKNNGEISAEIINENEKKGGIGILLKEERERKGYSIDEIAKILKIRKQYIDAIEREDWQNLPSPTYIKGFLRSYAKALKIDAEKMFDICKSNKAFKEEMPKPLLGPEESKKKIFFVILFLLCILAYPLYLWITSMTEVVDYKMTEDHKAVVEGVGDENKTPDESKEKLVTEVIRDTDPAELEEDGFAEIVNSDQENKQDAIDREMVGYPVITDTLELEGTDSISPESVIKGENHSDQLLNEGNHLLLLTGIVKMRTYLKIQIDDDPPKEYMLSPGSKPQWEARKGFDIIVGNAAGIEFDLNGKIKKDLGGVGKVVRIRFPEDFKAGSYEE